MAPNKTESTTDRLRAIQRSNPANRKCADCSEKGPTYVCLDFQIFVCVGCSGLHRQFGHRVKGISLSEWSSAEVAKMEKGGNTIAELKWLNRWSSSAHAAPDADDSQGLHEWIRLKYVEKKWFRPITIEARMEPSTEAAAAKPAMPAPISAPVVLAPPAAPEAACTLEVPAANIPMLDLLGGQSPPPAVKEPDAPEEPTASAPVTESKLPTEDIPMLDLLGGQSSPPAVKEPAAPEELIPSAPVTESWSADFGGVPEAQSAPSKLMNDLMDLDFSQTPIAQMQLSPEEPSPTLQEEETHSEALPSPTESVSDEGIDDAALTVGEQLRQAVLSGSQADIKELFEKCSKPSPKKAVDNDRFAAFAAFDEITSDMHMQSEQAQSEGLFQSSSQMPKDASGVATPSTQDDSPDELLAANQDPFFGLELAPAVTSAVTSGPQHFFIGDGSPTETTEESSQLASAATVATPTVTSRGLEAGLTPSQLQHMAPQDLMKMHSMISQALHAKVSQQPMPNLASQPSVNQSAFTATVAPPAQDDVWTTPTEPEKPVQFGELMTMFNEKIAPELVL
eukprot:TRINITY_DN76118_c0_g1_i1.p1 TRINITY_DN76118_c0_g1~~TRINITY_DN76118_c0_g1_i1.p1  ORF type:complete len:565 (+),score=153.31 TRINITY_DN76118_c0_g1_i1:65-1759(+)